MIRAGDTISVDAGTTRTEPVRLRVRTPCCQREHRPDYEGTEMAIRVFGHGSVRCNGCGWWWKITAITDAGDKINVTFQA